jgi:hypothetical protein
MAGFWCTVSSPRSSVAWANIAHKPAGFPISSRITVVDAGKAASAKERVYRALPVYTSLLLATVSACYLAHDLSTASVKAMLAVGVVIFNLPNTAATYWLRPLDTPEFFSGDTYRHYLSRREIVLILPYSYTGNSMLWQAQAHMYFDMAGGTTQPPPSGW